MSSYSVSGYVGSIIDLPFKPYVKNQYICESRLLNYTLRLIMVSISVKYLDLVQIFYGCDTTGVSFI